jgi:hypothetical protein
LKLIRARFVTGDWAALEAADGSPRLARRATLTAARFDEATAHPGGNVMITILAILINFWRKSWRFLTSNDTSFCHKLGFL